MRTEHAAAACGTALGYLGDLALGDPRRGHPVAAFGRAAAALERLLWRDHRAAGAGYALLCTSGAVLCAATLSGAADFAARRLRPRSARVGRWLPALPVAAGTWTALGGTGLAREARAVARALAAEDLQDARRRLPRLCGRDPAELDAGDITRAVVESVAENTSDAVVGALVWGAAAGLPGLAGFRAVNTLDAMVGHRSVRHRRFGWAAARLDDLAGWPGSRLTALLATVTGPDPNGSRRVLRRDGHRHPSPNAGPVEAAFAGALGVRLGGPLSYGGRTEHRPVLNPEGREPAVADIERAVRLSRRVGALAVLVCTAGRAAGGWAVAGLRAAEATTERRADR